MKDLFDTIAAISTPVGTGGISIIRMSGEKALEIAEKLSNKKIISEKINRVSIFDKNKNLLDFGIIIFFKKPKSFTGEDLIEFQIHGSEIITNSLLSSIIKLGARLSEPGEFTLRAYLNKKIDLIQAESINYLINSKILFHNEMLLKSMSGKFSDKLKVIEKKIFSLRQFLECSIEFPDDLFFNKEIFLKDFLEINLLFENLYKKLYTNHFFENEFKIVIIGNVNVGKSSLFNLLLKNERAIVSSLPGTTRDFIKDEFEISGIKINLIDTAGFNNETNCYIEKTGIIKTFEQIKESSIVIYMTDITKDNFKNEFEEFLKFTPNKIKIFLLKNKIDLKNINENIFYHKKYTEILLSVKESKGVNILINELKNLIFNIKDKVYIINKRNYNLFLKIKKNFEKILNCDENKLFLELQSEILKESHNLILEILGEKVSDDIIKSIFSKFCIGK